MLEQNALTAWYPLFSPSDPPNGTEEEEDVEVHADLQEAQSELSLQSLEQQAYARVLEVLHFVRVGFAPLACRTRRDVGKIVSRVGRSILQRRVAFLHDHAVVLSRG